MFDILAQPNVVWVLLGLSLLMVPSAWLGSMLVLRGKALLGDALAHAVLPGICLAYLLQGGRQPLLLLLGASASAGLSLAVVRLVQRHSPLKSDAAIAIVLSSFYGAGIVLLTFIQQLAWGNQSGLDSLLIGQAAALRPSDILPFGAIALSSTVLLGLFHRPLKLILFDKEQAQLLGLPVTALEWLFYSLAVVAIVLGIQAVGVVLMAAMLILPAAIASRWAQRYEAQLLLAVAFALLAVLGGGLVSASVAGMPTGPWIVTMSGMLLGASLLLAPAGFITRWLAERRRARKLTEENILKWLYQLEEKTGKEATEMEALLTKAHIPASSLRAGLGRLKRKGLLASLEPIQFTAEGRAMGQRQVRRHRLWESYLSTYLGLAPDHLHADAEAIEHLLTPELETQLAAALDHPEQDPHASAIPPAEKEKSS